MSAATSPDDPSDELRPSYDFTQLRWREGRGRHFNRYAQAARKHTLDLTPAPGDVPTSGLPSAGQSDERAARLRAFCDRVGREWVPWADGCTLPIWAAKPAEVCLAGSGTLFRVADTSFLVTAAHVYTDAEAGGWDLFVTAATDGAPEVHLNGGRVSVQPDPLDLLVWELPSAVVAHLAGRQFLSVHNADRRNRRTGEGLYALYGYPAETCPILGTVGVRVTAAAPPLTYITEQLSSQRPEPNRYDPDVHCLFTLSRTGYGFLNGLGTMPADLRGIGGSSIWQVYAAGMSATHWTVHQTAVVAVQTCVNYQLGYIRGTRWWVVDRLIREGWPHLAPALSLAVPDPHPAG